MSILACTMQMGKIKISFVHIVQPMNKSMADKLYNRALSMGNNWPYL